MECMDGCTHLCTVLGGPHILGCLVLEEVERVTAKFALVLFVRPQIARKYA
jgi:hypothetical protein